MWIRYRFLSLFCFLLWLKPITQAQKVPLSFETFSEQINIFDANYCSGVVAIREVNDQYEAVIQLDSTRLLMIKMQPADLSINASAAGENYQWQGMEANFFSMERMSYLLVTHQSKLFALKLGVDDLVEKSFLERAMQATGLLQWGSLAINWPEQIPDSLRIAEKIIKIEIEKSEAEGFEDEIHVFFMRSPKLMEEVKKLATTYTNHDDFIALPQMILVFHGGTISKFLSEINETELVQFTYYIKNN